jgi:hypothetical protein
LVLAKTVKTEAAIERMYAVVMGDVEMGGGQGMRNGGDHRGLGTDP